MFFKFAERYLCAVYRMRQLNITVAMDARSFMGGVYRRAHSNRLDPLAFMLEGTKCVNASCYLDFAEDRAIPADAMLAFRGFLNGNDARNNQWAKENPELSAELQNLAYGVFYTIRDSYNDSRYYLDLVHELNGKTKLKQMLTNPRAAKQRKMSLQELRERELAEIRARNEYNNQIW